MDFSLTLRLPSSVKWSFKHALDSVGSWSPYSSSQQSSEAAAADDDTAFFTEYIEPLLQNNCYDCHSHEVG